MLRGASKDCCTVLRTCVMIHALWYCCKAVSIPGMNLYSSTVLLAEVSYSSSGSSHCATRHINSTECCSDKATQAKHGTGVARLQRDCRPSCGPRNQPMVQHSCGESLAHGSPRGCLRWTGCNPTFLLNTEQIKRWEWFIHLGVESET